MVIKTIFQKKIYINFTNGKRISIIETRYWENKFKSKGVSLIKKNYQKKLKPIIKKYKNLISGKTKQKPKKF